MADQVKSGLDSISTDQPSNEIVTGGLAKPVAAKGPYALPTPSGTIGYDPELLNSMQKLIAERETQKHSFGETMKDALAWWSGGVAGPAESLRNRELDRERQEAELFQMKSQLSQAKLGMAQNQLMRDQIFGSTETGAQTNTLPPSHIAAGAPTQSSTLVQQGGMLGLVKDPALRSVLAQKAVTDPTGVTKAIQEYLAKNATDTDMIKDVNYMVQNGLIDPKLVPAAVLTKFVGSGAFVPHDVRGAGGTGQGTPFGAASGIVGGGNTGMPGAPAAPITRPAAPVATPAAPVARPAAPVAAPAAPVVAPTAPVARPAAPVAAPAAPVAAPAAPVAAPVARPAAPVAAPAESPVDAQIRAAGLNPTSKEALEMRQKAGETIIAGQGKQMEKTGEDAGVRFNKMRDLSERATNTIPTAQAVIDIADNPKLSKVMGFAHGTERLPTALTTAGSFMGLGDKTEEALYANYLSPEQRVAYKTVQGASQKLGIDFAADVFKGARMGIGLEKMAMGAKGVGTEMPAEINKRNAALIRDAAQFQKNKLDMWDTWKDSHGGKFADFNQFESSPEYIQFKDQAQQHFLNTYKGIIKPLGEEAGAHPAEKLVEKYRTKKNG